MWHFYILKCADDSYYVGHTNDLALRIQRHNSSQAAKWTACRIPVKLVYKEPYQSEEEAMRRERQIKNWSRAKKEALIRSDIGVLKILAKKKHTNPAF
ncbi:MAG: GIY-YIG nuclease family protein [Sedimentisphaerales bacterium]|jgi:predicted GIY-YIG superfamily endonuclease